MNNNNNLWVISFLYSSILNRAKQASLYTAAGKQRQAIMNVWIRPLLYVVR